MKQRAPPAPAPSFRDVEAARSSGTGGRNAPLSLQTMRPLLMAVLFFFVVLPLLIYNFFTLDERLAHWSSRVHVAANGLFADDRLGGPMRQNAFMPAALPSCMNVSSDRLVDADHAVLVQDECGPAINSNDAAAARPVVHFIYLPLEAVPLNDDEDAPAPVDFSYLNFVAVQSVRKMLRPSMMFMHYVHKEPRGYWYTQCQRHLSMQKMIAPKLPRPVNGSMPWSFAQRRQLMETMLLLGVMKRHGGVGFSDFNSYLLRPLQHLFQFDTVLSQTSELQGVGLGLHMLLTKPGDAIITQLEAHLLNLVVSQDARLLEEPLEEIAARFVTSKMDSEARTDGIVVGNSNLFEAVPLQQLTKFLATSLGDHSFTFQGKSAFHLAWHDFERGRARHSGLVALNATSHRLSESQHAMRDPSLFGALVRYLVTANATAELDTYF